MLSQFDYLIILLQNLTSLILNGYNKAQDEASRPNDVGGTIMDSINPKSNDDSSNGLKIQLFSEGEAGNEPTYRRQG